MIHDTNSHPSSCVTPTRPYPWHSVEGQMRQMGDLAFLLQEYEFAAATYRLAAQDYQTQSNNKWYAGVEVRLAVSMDHRVRDVQGLFARRAWISCLVRSYSSNTTIITKLQLVCHCVEYLARYHHHQQHHCHRNAQLAYHCVDGNFMDLRFSTGSLFGGHETNG